PSALVRAARPAGDPPACPHPGHHRHQRPPRLRPRHLPAPTSATDRGYAQYSRHSAPGPRPARTDPPDPGDPGRPSDLYPALQPAAGLLPQPGRGLVSAPARAPGPGRAGTPWPHGRALFRTAAGPFSLSSISQESRAATGCSGGPPEPALFLPNGHAATA